MKITKELLQYIAHLSRIYIDEEEEKKYLPQLNNILSYMEKLNTLDTTGIEPMSHAFFLPCPLREDRVTSSFEIDDALRNAPDRTKSFFRVPPIIEMEE